MNGGFRAALKSSGPALLTACVILFLVVGEPSEIGEVAPDGPSDWVHIEGDVLEPVSPGVMVSIDLKFTNPNNFGVVLTGLTVELRDLDTPNADDAHPCSLDDFAVEQAPADLQIPVTANATNTLSGLPLPPEDWPRLGMINHPVNQDGCKGASMTLRYTAAGRED